MTNAAHINRLQEHLKTLTSACRDLLWQCDLLDANPEAMDGFKARVPAIVHEMDTALHGIWTDQDFPQA
jgi:hypothetical protein